MRDVGLKDVTGGDVVDRVGDHRQVFIRIDGNTDGAGVEHVIVLILPPEQGVEGNVANRMPLTGEVVEHQGPGAVGQFDERPGPIIGGRGVTGGGRFDPTPEVVGEIADPPADKGKR